MSDLLPIKYQSIPNLFKTAGKIWKASMVPTLTFYLLDYALPILLGILDFLILKDPDLPSLMDSALNLLSMILSTGLFTCIVFRTNNIINNKEVSFARTVGYGFGNLSSVLGVVAVLLFGFMLGSILLIIPGLIFLGYYYFSIYFVIFGKGIFDSFKSSYNLVKNHWWRSFLILVIALSPYILGFSAFIVVILNLKVDYKQFMESRSTVFTVLAIQLLFIPINQFINSFFLAYFYDLKKRGQSRTIDNMPSMR